MTKFTYNTDLIRGATFSRSFRYSMITGPTPVCSSNPVVGDSCPPTSPVDLTGAMFDAKMRLMPSSCAGHSRTPITLTVNVTGDPTLGVFILYLTPAQTAVLRLGDYSYIVLFTPASSSDKFPIVSGTITVTDD